MKNYQWNLGIFYSNLVIIGTIIGESTELPSFYLSEKRNFLNQYFVKLGWAWTLSLLIIFLMSTRSNNFQRSIKRISFATIYYFILAQWCFGPPLLSRIYKSVGSCSILHLKEYHLCFQGGGEWDGLDISGHCFLLLHSSFLIWEEIRILRPNLLKQNKSRLLLLSSLSLFALIILWGVMLFITALYFHSVYEKILGTILGFGFWLVYYL